MTVTIISGAEDVDGANVLFRNIFAEVGYTVSSSDTGFSYINLASDDTYSAWKPTSVPATITSEFGALGAFLQINAIGFAAHDMGTRGTSFVLQTSPDGVTWTNAFSAQAVLSDDDILVLFPTTTASWWRLRFTGGVPTIGYFVVGQKLAFPCSPIDGHVAFHHSRKSEMLVSQSVAGQRLGNRVSSRSMEGSVDFGELERDFVEIDLAAFEAHYNSGAAFFYCGSPSATPKDFSFCWRPNGGDEMAIAWVEGDTLATVSFDVNGYVAA